MVQAPDPRGNSVPASKTHIAALPPHESTAEPTVPSPAASAADLAGEPAAQPAPQPATQKTAPSTAPSTGESPGESTLPPEPTRASAVTLQAQRELAELRSKLHAASVDGFAPSQLDFRLLSRGSPYKYRRFFRTYAEFVHSSGLKTARQRVLQTCIDRRAAAHAAAHGHNENTSASIDRPIPANAPAPMLSDLPPAVSPTNAEPIARQPIPDAPATPAARPIEPVYGDRIYGCRMAHAPMNEQGVVLLFGMLAEKLGYEIEMVRTGYPDCEAKRKGKDGKLRRVLIEFEFLSSRFNHPPQGCDMVVCWEDDNNVSGLEVLELKSFVNSAGQLVVPDPKKK